MLFFNNCQLFFVVEQKNQFASINTLEPLIHNLILRYLVMPRLGEGTAEAYPERNNNRTGALLRVALVLCALFVVKNILFTVSPLRPSLGKLPLDQSLKQKLMKVENTLLLLSYNFFDIFSVSLFIQDYRNEEITILKNSGLSQDAINAFVPPTASERMSEKITMAKEYMQLKEDVANLKEEVKMLKDKLGIVDGTNHNITATSKSVANHAV